jgi:hypothetical protein
MHTNYYIGYEKTKTPSLSVQEEKLDMFPFNIMVVPGRNQYCTSTLNSEISGSHNNNFGRLLSYKQPNGNMCWTIQSPFRQFKLFHMTLGITLGANVWPV